MSVAPEITRVIVPQMFSKGMPQYPGNDRNVIPGYVILSLNGTFFSGLSLDGSFENLLMLGNTDV